MSELIQIGNEQKNIRLDLLATTSAIALVACVAAAQPVAAADRPTVWIEGGWHFDSIAGSNDVLVPPLDELTTSGFSSTPTGSNFLGQGSGGFPSFTDMEKALGKSGGAEGSVSFQPRGSDWVFSISGRYGRAHANRSLVRRKDIYGETAYVGTTAFGVNPIHKSIPHSTIYVAQANENKEAHIILDFQVGKDVGIGLLGGGTQSVFSLGARYAQMNMSGTGHAYARPGVKFYGHGFFRSGKYQYKASHYRLNSATLLQRSSSFNGVGPSLSWSNTTGLVGNHDDGQLALDWGANAALLFGRQKVRVSYSTLTHAVYASAIVHSAGTAVHRTQSRRVTVPNLGGFAALSYRFTSAKLSAGYRADFFFGAMDGGLDTRRSMTTDYHGPYATISIGLGG